MTKRQNQWRVCTAFLLVLLVTILIIPAATVEASDEYDQYYDYIITGYRVDVVAHADNTYDVTETIDVMFNTYKHGIYRYIPTRYNGKLTPVTNINTYGEEAKIKNAGTNKYIRLGDADILVIDDKRYIISYTLNMGKDEYETMDIIYLDLIGTDWYTRIYDVTFNIDISELANTPTDINVTVGYEGSTSSAGVIVKEGDDIITGSLTRTLEPYEAVTLLVTLPEGTMAAGRDAFDFRKLFTLGVPLVTLVLLLAWTMQYGRKRKPIPVIEFYPPEGMNPTELGYVIDERVDSEDVGALIVYWATKGYLSIKEERFGKFTLIKSGEMDVGVSAYEMNAFKKLWKLGDGKQVKSSELRNKFYTQVASIQNGAKRPYESGNKRLYEQKPEKIAGYIMVLGALCLGVLAVTGVTAYSGSSDSVGGGLMFAIMLMGAYMFMSVAYDGVYKRRKKRNPGKRLCFMYCTLFSIWLLS